MPRCSRCGRDNAERTTTCAACGSALPGMGVPSLTARPPVMRPATPGPRPMPPRTATPGPGTAVRCAACGLVVPPGFKFCGGCGTPTAAATGPVTPAAPMPGVRRPGAPRARVSLLGPDGSILTTWPLIGDELTVGAAGQVRLTDPHAASLQGRLVVRGNGLFWRSETSGNGTFVLIKREAPLADRDELRVGRQLLRIERRTPAAPPPQPVWGSPDPGYRFQVVQVLAGGAQGDVFPLREGENLIGRTAGDLSFHTDGYVSSRHATLTVQGDQVVVRDLGSSNGTFVRLPVEAALEPGDLLLVGEQLFRVDP